MSTQAFLYKWTHIPSQKWYVGSRTEIGCHPDDGYICSSKTVKPMVLENRSEWKREILVLGEPKYIAELETRYLTYLKAKQDPMSFNEVNHWPNAGMVGKPSPLKGKKRPQCGRPGHPSSNKGKKFPGVSLANRLNKKGKKNPGVAKANKGNTRGHANKEGIGNGGATKGKPWSAARREAHLKGIKL